jgi:carbon-monoxide dehydrogenase large subunit
MAFAGRREDGPLLRGRGTFIDGLQIPELDGALHAHFVRSIEAHATLRSVDVSEAEAMPGVVAASPSTSISPSLPEKIWREITG